MPKWKYDKFEHEFGDIERGDLVYAFCTMADGKRSVVPATVVGINRLSVQVEYACSTDINAPKFRENLRKRHVILGYRDEPELPHNFLDYTEENFLNA